MKISEVPPDPKLRVAMSYGLGADSTAILLRWLHEPDTRPAPWDEIVLVTALTGDEWSVTGEQVSAHVLPELRRAGVRFIQAARSQRHVRRDGSGIVVLSDSRHPSRLHLEGSFALSTEMLTAGTLPQVGGARLCSVHAKGDVLDPILDRLFGDRPYLHVMGFEFNEKSRADKDSTFNTATRTGNYPLIRWGFTRDDVLDYIEGVTQVRWEKSACQFCPFSLTSKAGREASLTRYAAHPDVAGQVLFMEAVALALNPAQSLLGRGRLIDLVTEKMMDGVLEAFRRRMESAEHALYRVRRIYRAAGGDPLKKSPRADRSVQRIATGSLAQMTAAVRTYRELGADIDIDVAAGIERAYVRRRGDRYPTVEEFYVAAPAVVADKQAGNFDAWWEQMTGDEVALQLF